MKLCFINSLFLFIDLHLIIYQMLLSKATYKWGQYSACIIIRQVHILIMFFPKHIWFYQFQTTPILITTSNVVFNHL